MLSHSRGPVAPLIEEDVDEVFRQTVALVPGSDALISRHQKLRYTYAELDRQVELTARGLAGLGLRRADRVGIWVTNCDAHQLA
jgi:fatty-acyl-CoA synthase